MKVINGVTFAETSPTRPDITNAGDVQQRAALLVPRCPCRPQIARRVSSFHYFQSSKNYTFMTKIVSPTCYSDDTILLGRDLEEIAEAR